MNRGHLLQSSPVQQMMAGSPPNWWNLMNNMRPPSQQAAAASSSSFLGSPSRHHLNLLIPHSHFLPPPTWASEHHHHQHPELPPESWSQLLLGGSRFVGEEEQKTGLQAKKLENWEEQLLQQQQQQQQTPNMVVHLKQENSGGNGYNIYSHENAELIQASAKPNWSHQIMPVSSPTSCVTTLSSSNNMLDFTSNNNKKSHHRRHPLPDRSSECNSTSTIGGGAAKKARVQTSSNQSSFKVRKEKLGDRITALHQLVSPFGKTDTASVLIEAIGYIRFLQSQIEALSVPYLGNSNSGGYVRQQQHIQGGERNTLFSEDPGQLLNDNCMKRKARSDQDYCEEEPKKKDLRSRGLCLVPLSCTTHVGSENGADYWAPALGAGFR